MQRAFGIIVAVIIGIAVVGYKFSQKSDLSAEVHDRTLAALSELPDYDRSRKLYDAWFNIHHQMAFDANHRMGGRRSAPSFDGDGYLHDLFTAMISSADSMGRSDQAYQLRKMADQISWEEE